MNTTTPTQTLAAALSSLPPGAGVEIDHEFHPINASPDQGYWFLFRSKDGSGYTMTWCAPNPGGGASHRESGPPRMFDESGQEYWLD